MIRDDYLLEAYELLLTYCDDLIQSAGLIAKEKYSPHEAPCARALPTY